ncbi:MAG: radical SAM/SPASM domain-containing protein [Thermoproteota archaeon]
MQIIAEVTWLCPAKCPQCPLRDFQRTDVMSVENFAKVLKLFSRVAEARKESKAVVISGGEPSTLINLADYVEVAKNLGYTTTIVSNCFLPEKLFEAKPDVLEVSIDYMGVKHDEERGIPLWDKIAYVVRNYQGLLVVRSTLFNDNADDIVEIKRWVEEIRPYPFGGVFVVPVRGVKDRVPSYEQIKKIKEEGVFFENNCPAGVNSFTVTPDLKVLACFLARKELGRIRDFKEEELETILFKGSQLPRFLCELEK